MGCPPASTQSCPPAHGPRTSVGITKGLDPQGPDVNADFQAHPVSRAQEGQHLRAACPTPFPFSNRNPAPALICVAWEQWPLLLHPRLLGVAWGLSLASEHQPGAFCRTLRDCSVSTAARSGNHKAGSVTGPDTTVSLQGDLRPVQVRWKHWGSQGQNLSLTDQLRAHTEPFFSTTSP